MLFICLNCRRKFEILPAMAWGSLESLQIEALKLKRSMKVVEKTMPVGYEEQIGAVRG